MMDAIPQELRRALSAHARCQGRKLPAPIRAEAHAWAERQLATGATVASVAQELGLATETVRRWMASSATAKPVVALVPVEVVADESTRAGGSRYVTVVAPGGYRVEGLTVEEAATLLRVLR